MSDPNDGPPFVVLIIPCRNEEGHIGECVRSLLDSDYPEDKFEVVVLDGESEDGTRDVLDQLEQEHQNVRWIPNEGRTFPCAVNKGLRASQSEIVILCGAHAQYPPGFIGRNVELLIATGADDVGGIVHPLSTGTVQHDVTCRLVSHPLAIGDARHRTETDSDKVVEVPTVFGGCYWRSAMEKVGPFNEKLTRAQDREYNIRLHKIGGRVMMDPKIRCGYYPRATLGAYLKWLFGSSFWLQYAWRFTDEKMLRLRNYVPVAFVLWHFIVPIAFYVDLSIGYIASLPFMLYALMALWFGVSELIRGSRLPVALIMAPMLYLNHLAYGLGAIWGFLKGRVEGKDVFDAKSVSISYQQDQGRKEGVSIV